MASQSPQDEAGQARALGNDLYRAGKLESGKAISFVIAQHATYIFVSC